MIARSDCISLIQKAILGEAKPSHWLLKELSLFSQMKPEKLERHLNISCSYLQSAEPANIFNILSFNTTLDFFTGHNNNYLPDDISSGNCSSSR